MKLIQAANCPTAGTTTCPTFPADAKGMASRISGGKVLNALAKNVPWLLGGSADLAPSTKTLLTFDEAGGDFSADNYGGRNFHFGIREHGMAAAVNGMVLCGLRAFGATFFVFTDYCRPSMRLAAIMKIPSIFVFTHDSIGVGEDGPTHQPVEHLAACRAIPRLIVLRPGDANEAVRSLARGARSRTDRPVAMILTRQNLPTLDRTKYAPAAGVATRRLRAGRCARQGQARRHPHGHRQRSAARRRGLREARRRRHPQPRREPAVVRAVQRAAGQVSRRSAAAHRHRPDRDRSRRPPMLGPIPRLHGAFIGLDTYGASAPYQEIYKHRGITAEAIIAAAHKLLRPAKRSLLGRSRLSCAGIASLARPPASRPLSCPPRFSPTDNRNLRSPSSNHLATNRRCNTSAILAPLLAALLVGADRRPRCRYPRPKCRTMRSALSWSTTSQPSTPKSGDSPHCCNAICRVRCRFCKKSLASAMASTPTATSCSSCFRTATMANCRFCVWLPVADYDRFIKSLGATSIDGIAAATIAGEDLLVARRGDWALVMDPDQRERLAELAAATPAPPPMPAWKPWINSNDVTVVAFAPGLREFFAWLEDDRASCRTTQVRRQSIWRTRREPRRTPRSSPRTPSRASADVRKARKSSFANGPPQRRS